jgi:4-amino-4-deoxy-L-arabinose transferase-like glycosyltransferase
MVAGLGLPVRWAIFVTLLINAAAMLSPVINSGDAITFAAIAQHIALQGDWANLVLDGQDWLDKPHLPFWITALFFKVGGVSALTYILPGFLFHLVGGYYTYRIARLFYGRDVAWLSVLVYVSAFQLMDTAIEVRAEAYLTGFIMGACYYWLRYDAQAKWKYLLLGALFSACAVMTKGVFTLITIGSGFVCMWLYQKQWHKLLSAKWLGALALLLLFTAPELIALYLQFDAHPEKVEFGRTQVSGIRFFLWDSQFGRFFNTGPIQNRGGHPFYFVLIFLWGFLPWVGVFAAALFAGVRTFRACSADDRAHFVFLGGAFFITFILFSATSFQLDYYTAILFPFAAILCGKFLGGLLAAPRPARWLLIVQLFLTALLGAAAIGLGIYVANASVMAVLLALLIAWLVYAYLTKKQWRVMATLVYPAFAINMVYVFLALTTALTFATYETPYNVKKALAGQAVEPVYFYQMALESREFGLYSRMPSYAADSWTQLPANTGSYWLVVRDAQTAELQAHLPNMTQAAQGRWIVHKTGTLPKLLRLAREGEPLEGVSIMQVTAPVH